MKRLLGLLAWLSLALVAGGCDEALNSVDPQRVTCVDDDECTAVNVRSVCVIGVCVDPNNTALDQVHLEVRPSDMSGYQPQQLLEVQATSDYGRTEVWLRQTVNVHGNLIDGLLESAVASQVIAVQQDGIPGRALVVTTDAAAADGAFSLPLIELGRYSLAFYPNDTSRPPLFWADDDGNRHYSVTASATGDQSLQQPVGVPSTSELWRITGRVVAGEGTAQLGVEGLEVRVLDGTRRVSSLAKTDGFGEFQIALPPAAAESELVLEVRPTQENRMNPTVRRELPLLEGDLDLDDTQLGALQAPVPFAGVVSGPNGQPVPGASVYVRGALGEGTFAALITADDEGKYDAELRPARYDFVVVAPTSWPTAGLLSGYSAEVGGEAPAPVLNLPERLLVSGSVVDDEGQTVGNATVQMTRIAGVGGEIEPLLAGLGWTFSAVTDAEGRWQQRVDPGRYRLVIVPDASTTRPRLTKLIDVDLEHTSHAFRLDPSSVVAGLVTGVNGEGIGTSTVTAYATLIGESGTAIELGSAQTKGDGSFEILLPNLTPNPARE